MTHKIFLFNFFVLPFFFATCNSVEPPPQEKTITLTQEDVSCIETWLKLTTTNIQLPATLTLKKNNETLKTINLDKADTLLYIDSLLPNQQYTFLAAIRPSNHAGEVESNELSVTTLDTTSHNFTWQKFTFGEHSSSNLRDVAIIDENNIWAVGEIYSNDSLGNPDPQAYSVAIWDGQSWEFKKLFYNTNLIVAPIRGILVLNPSDIYLAAGSIFHWDGSSFSVQIVYSRLSLPDPNATVEKLWGHSNSSIYGVGNVGTIVFYNGISWQKLGSRTDLNINDIWGIIDKDGNKFILCSAYNFASGGEKKLLSISNNNVVGEIPWVENRSLYTVWFNTRDKIYAGGEGLFHRTNNEWKEETLPALFKFRVRGEELNDIWTAGGFGFAAHYNGASWKTFEEVSLAAGNYKGLAVKSNTVVLAGNERNRAVITIGRR